YVEGRYEYEVSPAYFEAMTPKFIVQGILLLGGGCDTTPKHIESMKRATLNVTPGIEKDTVQRPKVVHTHAKRSKDHVALVAKATKQTTAVVELYPRKTLDTLGFFEGARAIKGADAGAITLADNSLE
ncbi:homocysteine S-methyltransferase family protein, partial [Bacillus paranthracis]|uniref:homocysteine S-methyltransferase family protein n=1 Tax=Bacillus paranthracis TaxID=2026186 RepID=UPI002843C722